MGIYTALTECLYRVDLYLPFRSSRCNIYRWLTLGRLRFTENPLPPPLHAELMDYAYKIYLTSCERTADRIQELPVSAANIEACLADILEVEKQCYPEGNRIDAESLRLRFADFNKKQALCFLYYRDGRPVAYTLGTYLEFYSPFEYGFELGLHPHYGEFSAFYMENISVVPDEQGAWLSARAVIRIWMEAQQQGYVAVLGHALMDQRVHVLTRKMGFRTIMRRASFLGETARVALVYGRFPNA